MRLIGLYNRVRKMTKMTEKVAKGVLSGAVKVSGFFTSSVVNSAAGKKLFGLLPGEMVLATLDGFSKRELLYTIIFVYILKLNFVFVLCVCV